MFDIQSANNVRRISKIGRKVGITFGSFDLCHAGHMLMFKEAKKYCDYFVVGLQTDPTIDRPLIKNKPIMSIEERIIILSAVKYIDSIIVYETEDDLLEILESVYPSVRIIGADWKNKQFTGHNLPIPIIYTNRNHTFSSSELRNRVYLAEKDKNK